MRRKQFSSNKAELFDFKPYSRKLPLPPCTSVWSTRALFTMSVHCTYICVMLYFSSSPELQSLVNATDRKIISTASETFSSHIHRRPSILHRPFRWAVFWKTSHAVQAEHTSSQRGPGSSKMVSTMTSSKSSAFSALQMARAGECTRHGRTSTERDSFSKL